MPDLLNISSARLSQKQLFQVSVFTLILFWVLALVYPSRLVPLGYILGGMIVILLFYSVHRWLVGAWNDLPSRRFQIRLLSLALVIRTFVAIALYLFYKWKTGEPFEFYAVDSKFYHLVGTRLSESISQFNFNFTEQLKEVGFSDRGYNIYLGFIYSIFGPSIITVRLINVIYSAFSVWLIYRIAKNIFNEQVARSASLAALLLPNLMLYLGTHLKEPLMIFLVLLFLDATVRFIKGGERNLTLLMTLMLTGFSLFLFRTILGAVCLMSFAAYAITLKPLRKGWMNIFSAGALLVVLGYFMLNSEIGNELAEYLEKSQTAQTENMQFRATRDGGNKLAVMASAPLFVSIILIAPFPSVVFVFEQDLLWMFIGGNTIRNIYAIFVISAIIWIIRKDFRNSSLMLYFVLGYLLILANSGFAISERFHLPVVPFLLILAAKGMQNGHPGMRRFFPVYLVLIFLMILGWNYVKLAGRA